MPHSAHGHLSNWGRWGAADERGCFNLITSEGIKKAAGLIRTGKAYSPAVPLEAGGPQWPPRPKVWTVTTFRNNPAGISSAGDAMMLHSHSGTHMDALCHIWYGNQLFNGFSAAGHVTSSGATRNAIDKVPFIVGRAVLLDVAAWKRVDHLELGEPVTASDLDRCAAAQHVEIRSGDIVLVRTGWMRVFFQDRALFDSGEPGIDESTLPWLKQHDVLAVGADNHAVEVLKQIPPVDLPIHRAAIRDLGLYLVEELNLEEMAEDRAYQSFLVVAPLRLTGGAGSPINPIAIT
jgi:kynurenine formamidase